MTIKEYSCYLFDWLRFNSGEDLCSKCANCPPPDVNCPNADSNSVEFDYNYCFYGVKKYAEQQANKK